MASGGVLYSCDALLPTAERYVSSLFRRVSQMRMLDEGEERQLLAFVGVVGEDCAKWVFHWNRGAVSRFRALAHDVAGMIDQNWRSVTTEDAEKIWAATRDGGWTTGRLPDLVRMMLYERAHEGMTMTEMSKRYGLTPDQARRGSRRIVRRRGDQSEVGAAWAALGVA